VRFLESLGAGDKFRVAREGQVSLNNREVGRKLVLRITKVYAQSPHTVVAVEHTRPIRGGIYTLPPGTPVLSPREPDPAEERVLEFLTGKKAKRLTVVAYRPTWDGVQDLSKLLVPQAEVLSKIMFAFGKREYEARDLLNLVEANYDSFYGKRHKLGGRTLFNYYKRHMVDAGLLEEVVDEAPLSNREREANVHGRA
jgi:hypothetical protein